MIDRNDPRADLIFKAAGILGQLKKGCQQYIHESFEERQLTFSGMKQECENLIRLSEKAFPDSIGKIKDLTLQIMDEINSLSLRNDATDPGKCRVCNNEMVTSKVYMGKSPKLTYCPVCPAKIVELLNQLEIPTEVMWI